MRIFAADDFEFLDKGGGLVIQESNRVEFKSVLNDKMEKEIVAFLNNQEGGILYIGLDDNGHPTGLIDLDLTQLKIADRIKNNILPSTLGLFDIVTEVVEGVSVIKVLVSSGLEKPYYIKSQGMSPTGCYTRVGTSSQPMTTTMIDDLYARRIHTTLRNILSPRQDLKFAQLKIYYQERGLELNQQFANSLEFLTPDEKYNYIAYLLADENAVSIKVAKYAGTDKVDLIENEEYGYCSMIKATNSVLDKMKIENMTYTKVTSTKRIEKNLIDPVAMREAIVNCIVHNDFTHEIPPVFEIFSDKIIMTSYGGLIPGQSIEDFFSCSSMPRNRELMRVFKDVGLVEQLGSGMSRILKVYDKDIFHISDHFIKVVFPFSVTGIHRGIDNGTDNGIDNGIDNLLVILAEKPTITIKDMSEQLGFSVRKVNRLMKELRESGKITRVGSDRKGSWKINN
ncbi:MAG: putative DNA binding domain-containing protein [Saccharofermentans sp.]|jgi:predicted HTH transcriptional regulator|nr:putative DNA binding domain-containing protein [Mageeibacillus sp.]MCI1264660.1 putative DNA binding domain-containing protein [Saccharofermentans sp.]MCI1274797.1 putative DNA binding domain-containing protein [Saccharofermentans sp.]